MKPSYEDLKAELEVTDTLLIDRQRVLDAIPECEYHGSGTSSSNALKWIARAKDAMRWVESKKSKLKCMALSPDEEKFTGMVVCDDQLFVSTDSHIYRWDDGELERIEEA